MPLADPTSDRRSQAPCRVFFAEHGEIFMERGVRLVGTYSVPQPIAFAAFDARDPYKTWVLEEALSILQFTVGVCARNRMNSSINPVQTYYAHSWS